MSWHLLWLQRMPWSQYARNFRFVTEGSRRRAGFFRSRALYRSEANGFANPVSSSRKNPRCSSLP